MSCECADLTCAPVSVFQFCVFFQFYVFQEKTGGTLASKRRLRQVASKHIDMSLLGLHYLSVGMSER